MGNFDDMGNIHDSVLREDANAQKIVQRFSIHHVPKHAGSISWHVINQPVLELGAHVAFWASAIIAFLTV